MSDLRNSDSIASQLPLHVATKTVDGALAGKRHELHVAGLARLEAHGGAGGDVEAHASTARPLSANSPRGRFWMNRMISTRMAILPRTAPATGSRNLLAMPSVKAPTSVPQRLPTPPNTTTMLRDPARVAVTPVAATADRITQRILQVDFAAKPAVLAQLLKQEPVDRALVFTRTKHGADKVVKVLAKAGIEANAIHGNKSQNHRERVLAAFRTGEIRTLVATDIAARGIDVDGISHVPIIEFAALPARAGRHPYG